ncbi:hypothetical protein [Cohnella faecalis]|uniref:Uncharacterized protein n=1 Tax=Cohnella faecalis TaxID=2315694 RepID=A0A398CKG1_9BACL|nr:hypothetical protein [Cohnella faecalis]RIE01368.1 hypothetical protein D3H35_23650 [Cohnella faecalis]
MRRIAVGIVLALCIFGQAASIQASAIEQPNGTSESVPTMKEEDNSVQSKAFRSGRRTYRAPRSGYTGGNRTGVAPGTNTGRTTRTPAAGTTGRFGGFFGGLTAGSLLGGLLNPFGFGGWGGGTGASP